MSRRGGGIVEEPVESLMVTHRTDPQGTGYRLLPGTRRTGGGLREFQQPGVELGQR